VSLSITPALFPSIDGGPVMLEVERDGQKKMVPELFAWPDPAAVATATAR